MPFPAGTWTINHNGTIGQLSINAVDPAGTVTGTLSLPAGLGGGLVGFWDELAQKLVFADGTFTYRGFLFTDYNFRMPGITGSTVFTLAGSFDRIAGGTADRPTFGWYAQIGTA